MAQKHYKAQYVKSRKRIPLSSLITYLLLAVVLTLGASFSRFSTSDQSSDTARVAKFSITNNMAEQFQTIDVVMVPGKSAEYEIEITNDSEVAAAYVVTVERETKNLPLEIALTDGTGVLEPGGAKANPVVTVSWPEKNGNSHAFSYEIDLITVKLTAEQID